MVILWRIQNQLFIYFTTPDITFADICCFLFCYIVDFRSSFTVLTVVNFSFIGEQVIVHLPNIKSINFVIHIVLHESRHTLSFLWIIIN